MSGQNNTGGNVYASCTHITPECPVSQTIYTYRPDLAANSFFTAIFALCAIAQLILGIRFKTWTFMIALVLGCICELVGFVGRIMLHINPWDMSGFEIQIICLIIAPAFLSAGIYLTLKHFVLTFGEEFSWLKARLYTWIFISADILSLVMQGAGGGIEATSNTNSLLKVGSNISLAGIVFQVFSLVVFGILFAAYFITVYRHRAELNTKATTYTRAARFRLFFAAIVLAYLAILIRCVYRIPELAGGWRNGVMLNQVEFLVLDNTMVTIAALSLTLLHPGFFFGELSRVKKDHLSNVAEKEIATLSDDSALESGLKTPQ